MALLRDIYKDKISIQKVIDSLMIEDDKEIFQENYYYKVLDSVSHDPFYNATVIHLKDDIDVDHKDRESAELIIHCTGFIEYKENGKIMPINAWPLIEKLKELGYTPGPYQYPTY